MSLCSICGCNASPEAKFCPKCGAALSDENNNKNENGFIGKLHKCPNCGETIGAFQTKCPTCGMEFRNAEVTSTVKEFSERLIWLQQNGTSDQIVSFIRHFSVPNTREDMLEFMILASSNVDLSVYSGNKIIGKNKAKLAISEAWVTKMEQTYNKALISLNNDDITKIRDIYDTKQQEITKAINDNKKKKKRSKGIIIAIVAIVVTIVALPVVLEALLIAVFAVGGLGLMISEEAKLTPEEKYERELNNEVSLITYDIDNGDYDDAMMRAMGLKYDQFDDPEKKKEWEEKREYLISEIEEAQKKEQEKTPEEKYEEELIEEYEEIKLDISLGLYDDAWLKALDLKYDKYDNAEKEKEWDEKREALIELIKEKQNNNLEDNNEDE